MPTARFKGVFLCSSEDKNYPASNLLEKANKKWKCEEAGINSAYVVLQLEQSSKIIGVDIGNENSAFIEVSVGRNGWPIEKYKILFPASSFMTVTESRVSENPNRVRCFQKDALDAELLKEKWDLVKVNCIQNFNQQVKFGLSFVTIHISDVAPTSTVASPSVQSSKHSSPKEKKSCDEALGLPKTSVFAKFRIRGDSTDSDNSDKSASLFSKWKEEKNSPVKESNNLNISTAAAIRDASLSKASLEKCTKFNQRIQTPQAKGAKQTDNISPKKPIDRYRAAIFYDDEDENTSKPKLEKLISQDKERIERERQEQIDKKKAKKDSKNDTKKESVNETKKETTRKEQSKKKMETSAEKFKLFLESDIPIQTKEQSEADNSKVQKSDDDEGDDIVVVKPQSPQEVESSSPAHHSKTPSQGTPSQGTPPAWKPKNKRPSTSNDDSVKKRIRTSPESDEGPAKSPIDQILRGVVFVISGIQNPQRADMRAKGLALGAKYKPDWDNSCTHLISAFKNTPKYKQVQGKGIIVDRYWIEDCYERKKKLPWQDYEL